MEQRQSVKGMAEAISTIVCGSQAILAMAQENELADSVLPKRSGSSTTVRASTQ